MVNLDKKDTKVWLVKIPTFLFDKIQKLDDEAEIGKLRIYKEYFYFCNIRPQILRGKSEPKVELGLSVDQEWAQDLPKDYQVKFTNTNPINEYVFTEMGDVALEVSGKVQYEATLGPMNGEDQEYKKIMRSRTIDATTRNRNTMVMEAKEAKSVGLSRLMEKSTISFGVRLHRLHFVGINA
jgi:transcription initiation factor TFIIF subunit beta